MGRNRERTSINSHRTSTYVCLSVSVPAFGCLFSSCGRTVCFRERPLCTDPITQVLSATHSRDCRFPPLPQILALSVQTCLLLQKVLLGPMSAVAAALFLFPLLLQFPERISVESLLYACSSHSVSPLPHSLLNCVVSLLAPALLPGVVTVPADRHVSRSTDAQSADFIYWRHVICFVVLPRCAPA